ncbi:MAG: histidine phosphatase family protein [Deltaproteobacteria bacterium]|nr:histidine phosphatase family protein [Deltaproteobacteria bacterium]
MKNMLWIRHGQASLGTDNYDRLSDHGQHQSEKLGRFLGADGPPLLVHGPLERQRHTAALIAKGMVEAGADAPDVEEDSGLREYPAFKLFAHALPQFEGHEQVKLLSDGDATQHHPRLFKWLMQRWVNGEINLDDTDILSFVNFKENVKASFERLLLRARETEVAAVSSGGPIGVALGLALSLSDDMSMEMAWRVSNSSVARYRVEDGKPFLSGFHHHHHLNDDEVTFI